MVLQKKLRQSCLLRVVGARFTKEQRDDRPRGEEVMKLRRPGFSVIQWTTLVRIAGYGGHVAKLPPGSADRWIASDGTKPVASYVGSTGWHLLNCREKTLRALLKKGLLEDSPDKTFTIPVEPRYGLWRISRAGLDLLARPTCYQCRERWVHKDGGSFCGDKCAAIYAEDQLTDTKWCDQCVDWVYSDAHNGISDHSLTAGASDPGCG
jgi:hypothetical protein